jgi:hypothetical protein
MPRAIDVHISEYLITLLMQKEGAVKTAEVNEVGESNERLRLLVNSGELERAVPFSAYIYSPRRV